MGEEIRVSYRRKEEYNGERNNMVAVLVWESVKTLRRQSDKISDRIKSGVCRYLDLVGIGYIKVKVCERKCRTVGHVFLNKILKGEAYGEGEQACVRSSNLKISKGDFMF